MRPTFIKERSAIVKLAKQLGVEVAGLVLIAVAAVRLDFAARRGLAALFDRRRVRLPQSGVPFINCDLVDSRLSFAVLFCSALLTGTVEEPSCGRESIRAGDRSSLHGGRGNANNEIGAQLDITEETAKGHLQNIMRNSAPMTGRTPYHRAEARNHRTLTIPRKGCPTKPPFGVPAFA